MAKGGKRPGAGRKPGSKSKTGADVKAVAIGYSSQAIETLAQIMQNDAAPPAARVAAADKILDRAIGKPAQAITGADGAPLIPKTLVFKGIMASGKP